MCPVHRTLGRFLTLWQVSWTRHQLLMLSLGDLLSLLYSRPRAPEVLGMAIPQILRPLTVPALNSASYPSIAMWGLWLLLPPCTFYCSQSLCLIAQAQGDLQYLCLWIQGLRRSLDLVRLTGMSTCCKQGARLLFTPRTDVITKGDTVAQGLGHSTCSIHFVK